MIPKRIFYVWGYGEEKSRLADICIENWRMVLPDYEIIEVNEKAKEWFDFDHEYNNNLWFKTVYDLKMWAYVADYIRVKTLYEHGGIYFDTDITAYQDLSPLLNQPMFIGNCLNNIPELAVFGVEKNHPFLKDMIDFYENNIWQSSEYIITKIFLNIINSKHNIKPSLNEIVKTDDITIYPPEYFHPFHYSQRFSHDCITKQTYTVHWMGASWHSKKNLFFLSNKNKIPLQTLLKQLAFIEKNDKDALKKVTVSQ